MDVPATPRAVIALSAGAGEFASRVAEAASAAGTELVVDLSGIEAIDSVMLASLVGADKAVRAAGGNMTLVSIAPAARHTLESTGLATRLRIQ